MFTENGITFSKVIVAVGSSDLRRGIDGLSAMIRLKYDLDPLEKDTLFLFCRTRSDRIKGILWTGDRFVSKRQTTRLATLGILWHTLKNAKNY